MPKKKDSPAVAAMRTDPAYLTAADKYVRGSTAVYYGQATAAQKAKAKKLHAALAKVVGDGWSKADKARLLDFDRKEFMAERVDLWAKAKRKSAANVKRADNPPKVTVSIPNKKLVDMLQQEEYAERFNERFNDLMRPDSTVTNEQLEKSWIPFIERDVKEQPRYWGRKIDLLAVREALAQRKKTNWGKPKAQNLIKGMEYRHLQPKEHKK